MSKQQESDLMKLWRQLQDKYPKYLWGWREHEGTVRLSIMERSSRAISKTMTLQNDLSWKDYGKYWMEMYKAVQV